MNEHITVRNLLSYIESVLEDESLSGHPFKMQLSGFDQRGEVLSFGYNEDQGHFYFTLQNYWNNQKIGKIGAPLTVGDVYWYLKRLINRGVVRSDLVVRMQKEGSPDKVPSHYLESFMFDHSTSKHFIVRLRFPQEELETND